MSYDQNLDAGSSLCELPARIFSPGICSSHPRQDYERRTHYSPVPIANGSPEQRYDHSGLRMSNGSSPSDSSPANRSNLSTASPPYMMRTSPTGFPRTSPPHFTDTSPMALCSMYLRCISPSSYSATSPQRYSSVSPPDLSNGSPPGPSSLDSGTNSQSTDSDFLNLAVALRNMEVELNKHITENPSCENGNGSPGRESRGRSSLNTTSTHLYEHQTIIPTAEADMSSTPMSRHAINNIPSMDSMSYCPRNIHTANYIRYCLTCSQPFCMDCGVGHHGKHTYVNFVDFLGRAVMQAKETMNEVRLSLNVLQTDLDKVELDADLLDEKAMRAANDVRLCTRRLASAVEAREKELLSLIEKARVQKFTVLKAKGEHLRNEKTRLTRAAYKLSTVLESCTFASNPKEILANKDTALAEMFQIEQNRQYQPTREENWISFTGPSNNLMHAIATLGSIGTNNPGPIGEGRVNYNDNSMQTYFPYSTRIPLKQLARGRPVSSNGYPVNVREHQSHSKVIKIIGDNGDASDNLCRPWGVTCDNMGHIIVADRSNNRIQIYREDGTFVRRFGSQGTGPCQFDRPAGVAVDSRQRIIIADKDNHRIQILRMDGTFVHSFGQKGYRGGQFNYPWDVAVNSECQIAVSDTRNHRVQLFSPDGVFLYKYGYDTTPNMWKHFDSPRGVCFTPEGNLITTDFNNHHLVLIDSRFSNARTIICEAADGGTKPFLRPQGLVVDDNGNIIVADSRNHRIQVFDSTGRFLWKYGNHGTSVNEMDRPAGVTLLPNRKIAIVDFGNNRVLLLEHVDDHRL